MSAIRNYRRVIFGVVFNCQRQREGTYKVRVYNPRAVQWQFFGNFANMQSFKDYVLDCPDTLNF